MSKISFFAYQTLRYGVGVADADVDGDRFGEILTGPGPSAAFGSQVRGFNYDGASVTAISKINFVAFPGIQYGVNVAGGDLDRDGYGEIATAPGPGLTAAYEARFLGFHFDGSAIAPMTGFDVSPYPGWAYGGRVGVGDITSDGRSDLLTGAGRDPQANSTVKTYDYVGTGLNPLPATFVPFTGYFGVNVAAAALGY